MFDIQEELKKIPTSPGVYIHHDRRDEIIYIGKAKNLKPGQSIFPKQSGHPEDRKNGESDCLF